MIECSICGFVKEYKFELIMYNRAYICGTDMSGMYNTIKLTSPQYVVRCSHCQSAVDIHITDETNFIIRDTFREYLRTYSDLLIEYLE